MADIISEFTQNPATWIDPLELVSTRLLETIKRSTPTIGGPWQVVRLNARGARWISRPPQQATVPLGDLATATIESFTEIIAPTISGPTIVCAEGNVTLTISPTAHLGGPGMSIVDSSVVDRTTMFFAGMVSTYQTSQPSCKAELSPGVLSLEDASGNLAGVFPTGLVIGALPSSSPGAGTKRFWYDPADGNRVKYTP
jgi:hypothetical protein